mmetsp:Transcript_24539/g.60665  ORF Transcript_24539/g.60665 Transcript_24539/m.60665 type:complete len:245 (+) Transcript_24539:1650-2384(+)
MQVAYQPSECVIAPDMRLDVEVVGAVVSMSGAGSEDGIQVQSVHTQLFEVVDRLADAVKIAVVEVHAPPLLVLERLRAPLHFQRGMAVEVILVLTHTQATLLPLPESVWKNLVEDGGGDPLGVLEVRHDEEVEGLRRVDLVHAPPRVEDEALSGLQHKVVRQSGLTEGELTPVDAEHGCGGDGVADQVHPDVVRCAIQNGTQEHCFDLVCLEEPEIEGDGVKEGGVGVGHEVSVGLMEDGVDPS